MTTARKPTERETYEALFGTPDIEAQNVRDFNAARQRAQEAFGRAQIVDAKAGRPIWALLNNIDDEWLELSRSDLPGTIVRVRIAPTVDGVACVGIHLEREGRALAARDLRKIKLRPLIEGYLAGHADLLRTAGITTPVLPARPGRRGYDDDFWADVHQRYLRNRQLHPHRFVQAMREEWPLDERPSDAAMRRWVKTVQLKIERGELS
jgi:hypothetical protein